MSDTLFPQASWEKGEMDACLNLCASAELLHDLVQGIVSALEARDPHTAEHSLRVGDMVEQTCLAMGLPAEQVMSIHMAAHVHDIGKIAIPDSILLKKGRRTPEEHAVLRDHARMGAEILGRCASLEPIALIVRYHHERWDGQGYPDGLAGTDIPLGSRIIAVCDSIDSMLGKRLSSKRKTQDECREQIEQGAGSAYDPDIALFVVAHWDQIVGGIDFHDSADFDTLEVCPGRALRCSVPTGRSLELTA